MSTSESIVKNDTTKNNKPFSDWTLSDLPLCQCK